MGRKAASVDDLAVRSAPYFLEPQTGLGQNVGREGEVRVDSKSLLVHNEVAIGVQMAVVHLGLWGRGDVVVVLA